MLLLLLLACFFLCFLLLFGYALTSSQFFTIIVGMGTLRCVQWKSLVSPFAIMDVLESSHGLLSFLTLSSTGKVTKENFSPEKNLMIVLPGNPCIVECYRQFADKLRSSCACDVLVLGYPGHTSKQHNGNCLFTLDDQIKICNSFFSSLFRKQYEDMSRKEFIEENTVLSMPSETKALNGYGGRVYLAGHSIGAYIGLKMLAQYASFIKLFFGLAPVLSRIGESPNGRRLTFIKIPSVNWGVQTLGSALCLLPRRILKLLSSSYAKSIDSELREEIFSTLHGAQIRNILCLLESELNSVVEPDWALLQSVQERMVLYYVPGDRWAPRVHAEEIHDACKKLHGYIMEDESFNVSHAWCLADNDIVILHAISPYL